VNVQFHPAADEELLESAGYYEERVDGLGIDFLTAVEQAVARIEQFPSAAPAEASDIRKKLVIGFPFAVLYSYHQQSVLILAVAHLHRRPGYWKDRLRS